MKIPIDTLKKWNRLKSHGDFVKIAEAGGLTKNKVTRAFQEGECSDSVFLAIGRFYKEKEKKVKTVI